VGTVPRRLVTPPTVKVKRLSLRFVMLGLNPRNHAVMFVRDARFPGPLPEALGVDARFHAWLRRGSAPG